ncbi:hypothetical protein ACH9DO_09245 [Kocuria sp. M1N1S27]|uniref:hypothetical protein n=1 Tax=Kocuria kalidii TaxID=3376283 RepID=UPI003791EF8D
MKYVLPLLLIAVGLAMGIAGIVHGEADDSPGLQLLGVLLVLATVVLGVRTARRSG